MRFYTLNDLIKSIPRTYLDRGRGYHRQGRVSDVAFLDEGRTVKGAVRGSGRNVYRQTVRFRERRDGVEIIGDCTCPVGFNCKHVAAVLLEGLSRPEGRVLHPQHVHARDPVIADWLRQLEEASKPSLGNDYPPDVAQRLIYVLRAERAVIGSLQARLHIYSVRLLKNGGFGANPSRYDAANIWNREPAKFLRPIDIEILQRVGRTRAAMASVSNGYTLAGSEGAGILASLLETGRCRWNGLEGPPLSLGAPRSATVGWELNPQGAQQLQIVADPPGSAILPVAPPWYIDEHGGVCGPLTLDLSDDVAAVLASAPTIPPERAGAVRDELTKRFPSAGIPMPTELGKPKRVTLKPSPRLFLEIARLPSTRRYAWGRPELIEVPVARLGFSYGSTRFEADDGRAETTVLQDGHLLTVSRDMDAEARAFDRLAGFGFEPIRDLGLYTLPPERRLDLLMLDEEPEFALLEFQRTGIAELRAEGWTIEFAEGYPLRLAEAEDAWYADVAEGSGIDWFGFSLGVLVEGEPVNLLPFLVNILEDLDSAEKISQFLNGPTDKPLYLRLADDRLLSLPMERVQTIVGALLDLYHANEMNEDGHIPLHSLQAADLAQVEDELAALDLQWSGGKALLETGRKLRGFSGVEEVAVPRAFVGALRGYQRAGLSWLQFLRAYDFGGILADDMGLGKTVQTIAHLLVEKEAGRMDRPCLIVAPTSLMANWRHELAQFAPSLTVLILHGPDRKDRFDEIQRHDVILTTYPLLPRDEKILLAQEFHLTILDEAQVIKNPKTRIARIARRLPARHRLCLTGTPMENHLGELWSQFHFLMPGLLGDEKRFRRAFRTPIEKQGRTDRQQFLGRRVRPFLLRRTKDEVATELPPKTEIIEYVELGLAQRDLYESIRLAMNEKVRREIDNKGIARSQIVILDALLKLRQVCCDPRLLKSHNGQKAILSAKFTRLVEMVTEMVEEGRRILLFSQFTTMLSLMEAELKAQNIDYVKLTGQTRNRSMVIDQFQSGNVPLFLISLKAGGTGLNLTAADTVIHYDPWWNPAVERQATDRAHRIGQDKPVFVYKMLTVGTVEEKIQELQNRKQDLANGILGKASPDGTNLSLEDLEALFAPLE
ncbi:MAG: DEAD/DEAH box helicase [Alphaproteobacteria bacterium]|nr:DEAD/DEAH box helicase [Alphaproteobacteria bacterium]